MASIKELKRRIEPVTRRTTAYYDAILADMIVRGAAQVPFNNRPGSHERLRSLYLLLAAISARMSLEFPHVSAALDGALFDPATTGNPASEGIARHLQQEQEVAR
ncbi:hypothetical protein [Paraburkholderia aspalathi]|uniref:Uncharacterized protein n=1 Tax=Paraburkholderia aspalathi TaxID=1324617 RepID=A0A1I7ELD6_9BURK|nr:hypothetical protein [Paraburkholderia aspalathi]SFU24699.1 hypothetical protein SAMN05192563_10297 [Paraburkholderia aspalathi]